MALYLIPNGAEGLTAAPIAVASGTAIKTMLQFQPSATLGAKVVEWGISHDGSSAAEPGDIELVETGTVAATVTAHADASICRYDAEAIAGGDPTTNLIQVGTEATGYTSTVEDTTVATRLFDLQHVAPTNQYVHQFPLGREPFIQTGNILRVRVTFAVSINVYCYLLVEI